MKPSYLKRVLATAMVALAIFGAATATAVSTHRESTVASDHPSDGDSPWG